MKQLAAGHTIWLLDLRSPRRHCWLDRWHGSGLISDGELALAGRYRHPEARLQFLAGRALVRHALNAQAQCAPRKAAIVADAMGKPRLAGRDPESDWHFNVSHSGNLVACAIARSPVGIDVESTAREVDRLAIARAHFSPGEASWIAARPARGKDRFTALWTSKESYLKAVGVGLSIPLDSLSVSAVKRGSCRMRSRDALPGTNWYCRVIGSLPGYWLSICSEAPISTLDLRWFDE